MGMSEEVFFKSTPRKITSLWKIHSRFNGLEVQDLDDESERTQFIDEIPFL